MKMPSDDAQIRTTGWLVRRTLIGVMIYGAIVQIALIVYYLGAAHSPQPHNLPVGYVADESQAAAVQAQIESGGSFAATRFPDAAAMIGAIEVKVVYGGVDLTGAQPQLYVASAAGPSAASVIRTTFTQVVEQQRTAQVQQLVASGGDVPVATVQALTTPPAITDLVPLPDADRGAAALGLLVQVLAIGATIASTELGKIGSHTKRSPRRGFAHAGVLVLYSLVSAGAVTLGAGIFGAIPDGQLLSLFVSFSLLSLALSCSVAAAVALFGPGGAMLGTLYFLLGLVISGASIIPEFLPTWARVFGQALPPGAGATLIRERLYFPGASVAWPVGVLLAWAVTGLLIVLVTNVLPSRGPKPADHLTPVG